MHCACNTVQLLRRSRLPFSWTMPPNSPTWTPWLQQDLGSHTAAWVWVASQKGLKKSRSDWLNSGNALTQHLTEKMRLLCFPVLPGSVEAQLIWGGIVKGFWLLTLSVTFLPKKYQNAFMYVKVIANQRWDVFWDTVYLLTLHMARNGHSVEWVKRTMSILRHEWRQ